MESPWLRKRGNLECTLPKTVKKFKKLYGGHFQKCCSSLYDFNENKF